MTRDEAKEILGMIDAMYPSWKPENLTATADAWAFVLEDYDFCEIKAALKIYIRGNSSNFAPSPGQLIGKLSELKYGDELGEMEAWSLVYKAICRSGYYAEEEFEKLPETIQKVLGNPSTLKEMAMMDAETVKSVEQSHFLRNYRTMVERKKEMLALPDSVRHIAEDASNLLEGKEKKGAYA